ncbi:MAG: hypothetical protein H8E45_04705 [Proteobacteria bacterium]|nr:hypothetical protein [Pseudomonadota bacterium]
MGSNRNSQVTFAEIEQANAGPAAGALAGRARLANCIAHGGCAFVARGRAFSVKSDAIVHAIEKFPRQWSLDGVENDGHLLGVTWQGASRQPVSLHLPVDQLSPAARCWLDGELARIELLYDQRLEIA